MENPRLNDVATVTVEDSDSMPLFTELILAHDMLSELHLFHLFAVVITVGYVQTAVTVLESDGVSVATLTVAISHCLLEKFRLKHLLLCLSAQWREQQQVSHGGLDWS